MSLVNNMKQRSVNAYDFAMAPRAEIPRSSFPILKGLKTTFNASELVPCFVEEVLPGDTWRVNLTAVVRTAVPITPVMDNWHLETFFFFVPNRLVWTNWEKFMGEQDNPGDSIAYTIPQVQSPAGGFPILSIADYMGLPCVGQTTGVNVVSVSALPFRGYNLIYREWFRDQNLQNSSTYPLQTGDGPDAYNANYGFPFIRGKRPDYFTTALPSLQKGGAVFLPLGTQAPVKPNATNVIGGTQVAVNFLTTAGAAPANQLLGLNGGQLTNNALAVGGWGNQVYPANLIADLSAATAATVNALRQAFQIQKLLERDARSGTRYVETVKAHFGIQMPDFRAQRPEYTGGGRIAVNFNAIPQTSATGLTGGTTPAGTLSATGSAQGSMGFSYSATEHGHIIGLANVRADLTYDQGIRKFWKRATRYDFYYPVFQALGEQSVFNYEIYSDGSANDNNVFGYQERHAEYRYNPSQITGLFRARSAGNIAYWHSAENFATLPALNATFIADNTKAVLARNFAGGALANGQQFICDLLYTGTMVRPLPTRAPPGFIDHF